MSQLLATYGLWILLVLIFVAMFLFGFSTCRIDHPPALKAGKDEAEREKEL